MSKKQYLIPLYLLICSLLACSLITTPVAQAPAAQEPSINVETAVARTRAFDFAVQTAAAANPAAPNNQVVQATSQQVAPTNEPTVGPPMISASMDTNCRTGPSTVYEAISYLIVGKTSEVVNKYLNGAWWVIKDPNNPNKRCWVQGATTNVTGNWQQLAEATLPPTPTVELKVTVAMGGMAPAIWVNLCPAVITGAGTITVNAPTTVEYKWERSGGLSLGNGSAVFAAAGTQVINVATTFLSSSSDTVRIHITSPVNIFSESAPYNVICNP